MYTILYILYGIDDTLRMFMNFELCSFVNGLLHHDKALKCMNTLIL